MLDVVEWKLTLQGLLSDKWLSKYWLLENYNAKILSIGYVLDFDL